MIDNIYRCSDEYSELMKNKRPGMYKYYKGITQEDFLKLVGMIIYFGYRKIPQYRLAWKRTSLCYDPFISSSMSRNKFESLMSFLHLVDLATEEKLKSEGDKLAKVNYYMYVYNLLCYFVYRYGPLVITYRKHVWNYTNLMQR